MRPAAPARLRPPQTLGAGFRISGGVALCAALLLAACAAPPDAKAPADAGPWPELLPLGPILAAGANQPVAPDSAAAGPAADAARAAALRARADRLLAESP